MAETHRDIPTAKSNERRHHQPWLAHRSQIPEHRRSITGATKLILLCVAAFATCSLLAIQNKLPNLSLCRGRSSPVDVMAAYPPTAVDISHVFNNVAAGPGADFDPHEHGSYEAEYLPTHSFLYDGVRFVLPSNWSDGKPDNVVAHGERIDVPREPTFIRELHVLYAGDWIDGESGNTFTLNYADGTSDDVQLSAKNWWTLHWLNQGVIRTPYHFDGAGTKNTNVTQIYHWSAGIRSHSPLVSISLPQSSWPNHFHLFALSLVPCAPHAPSHPPISIRRVVPTTNWRMISGLKAFAVEITMTNPLPSMYAPDRKSWIKGPYYLGIGGSQVKTVEPGVVDRVMPSDEVRVKAWVVPVSNSSFASSEGVQGMVKVIVQNAEGNIIAAQGDYDVSGLFASDPATRDTPEWWDDAKFGIFIHWGLYSVPGWAPYGWYAAWYYWWMHKWPNSSNGFWRYHKEHYGTDIVYDDFIDMFTASEFNASEWINLFGDAGAKYFVLVTKHHDGFALFDTKDSTHRSSYHLGPKRDFIRELFDAAKSERPDLKRGTYISMPEWYNPDAGAGGYGFGSWPGELAHNAYDDSKLEPYVGRLEGKDYLRDVQLEHMKILAHDYESEIMWCDIGGPNLSREFARDWYPFAESQGRQVVMNNRCGDLPQFDTPEYARFSSIQTVKWETSEGIDPTCYAYNRDTKDDEYKSAQTVLRSLIDIVSKNGNYLIGLGPTGDGIIVKPVVDRMLEVGQWLKHSGECIYATKYFFLGAELGNIRFTQTDSTFCIVSLSRPEGSMFEVDRDVPIMEGDKVSLLGGGEDGEDLNWRTEGRKLLIEVPQQALDRVDLAWAFQVKYSS